MRLAQISRMSGVWVDVVKIRHINRCLRSSLFPVYQQDLCTQQEQKQSSLLTKVRIRSYLTSTSIMQKTSPFDTSPNVVSDPTEPQSPSPLAENSKKKHPLKKKHDFIPNKAAVELTDRAREFFKALLENPPRPEICGIRLEYHQSKTGEPRMVFSFGFITPKDLEEDSNGGEGVTLRVDEKTGKPLTPAETLHDGQRKLYISSHAFLKVLGATVDVDPETMQPILYDQEGNTMDPNA